MRSLILTLLLGLLCHNLCLAQLKFKETGYGLVEANVVGTYENDDSPTQQMLTADGVSLVKKTDSIPCTIGTQFGFFYRAKFKLDVAIPVTVVWTFPKDIVSVDDEEMSQLSYSSFVYTNEVSYFFYMLEDEVELVKGPWKIEVYLDEKQLLHERTFILY